MAIIPARAGSKGLSGKNMRTILGKTLVQHSIEHAQASKHVIDILVSSDSDEILRHAESLGAVPIVRPAELATDRAATDPVMVHALEVWLPLFKRELPLLTVLLQPTSPIRDGGLIDRCIGETLGKNSSFTAYDAHFAWRRQVRRRMGGYGDGEPFLLNNLLSDSVPRQEMTPSEKVYVENGSVYVTNTEELLKTGNRLVSPVEIVEMTKEDSIDIDTEYDLWLAEQRLRWLSLATPPENMSPEEIAAASVDSGLMIDEVFESA